MWSVTLTQSAVEDLQALSDDDRAEVLAAIGRLTLGPMPPGMPQPYRLRNRTDLLVLRAGQRYRVAYTVPTGEQTIRVISVISHDRVSEYPEASVA